MVLKAKIREVVDGEGNAVAIIDNKIVGGAVVVPDYLKDYKGPMGTENIDRDDIAIPQLKVGQDMTPAVQQGDLERGDIYLSTSGEKVAGPGEKLGFVLIAQGKEYVLWRPRKDNGGGILARANKVKVGEEFKYEWNEPNTDFNVKIEGKIPVVWHTGQYIEDDGLGEWGSEIPGDKDSGIAATAHHNYVVYIPSLDMIAALSMARSQVKKAKAFNSLLKMGNTPIWARSFTLESVDETKDGNEFKNIAIKPAGFADEALAMRAKALFEDFGVKRFTVDQPDFEAEATDERE